MGRAVEATARLLAGRLTPEGARLVGPVLAICRPERAEAFSGGAGRRSALRPWPPRWNRSCPRAPSGVDGTVKSLASWLRVWDWSAVLPEVLLDGFGPLLAAVRRLRQAGPPDLRAAEILMPLQRTVALAEEELLELAAGAGPLEAAAARAAVEDTGADGYAIVPHRLGEASPAAWTADVPAVLTALSATRLRACPQVGVQVVGGEVGRAGLSAPIARGGSFKAPHRWS
ncbi:hypothetical protein AB0N77_21105 [Streptomyces misionensis]|uniref:hypothetical protein n=1 Tax=Streptomyces misionensis TaxID=67331 RepID=UPI00341B7E64